MKCAAHNAEAVAICSWCGKALCPDCAKPSDSKRMVCSDDCATALAREARALDSILQKSRQNTQANAFYYYLCGALCAGGAVGANFYLQVPFLIWFCAGCAVLFTASGTWYLWIARKSRD